MESSLASASPALGSAEALGRAGVAFVSHLSPVSQLPVLWLGKQGGRTFGGGHIKAPVNVLAGGAQSVLASSSMSTAKDTRSSSGVSTASLEGTGQIWRLLTLLGVNSGVDIHESRWVYRTEVQHPAADTGN